MKRDNDEIKKYKTHQNSGSILALFFIIIIIKTIYLHKKKQYKYLKFSCL